MRTSRIGVHRCAIIDGVSERLGEKNAFAVERNRLIAGREVAGHDWVVHFIETSQLIKMAQDRINEKTYLNTERYHRKPLILRFRLSLSLVLRHPSQTRSAILTSREQDHASQTPKLKRYASDLHQLATKLRRVRDVPFNVEKAYELASCPPPLV